MDYRRWFRLRAQSPDDVAREIDDELSAHVAMRAEDLVRRGEQPERARATALQRFGDYAHARSDLIEAARGRRNRRMSIAW